MVEHICPTHAVSVTYTLGVTTVIQYYIECVRVPCRPVWTPILPPISDPAGATSVRAAGEKNCRTSRRRVLRT
jgi:hypothetical protein